MGTSNGTTVATRPAQSPAAYGWRAIARVVEQEEVQQKLTPFLPKGTSYAQFIAVLQLEAAKNPKIAKCSTQSILQAVSQALRSGLEIGTQCYLIPYEDRKGNTVTLTFVPDYKGLAALAVASGAVRHVTWGVVYEKELDSFVCTYGTEGKLFHQPMIASGPRGKMIGAYVIFHLPFSRSSHYFMRLDEIEVVRAKSAQWKPEKIGECPEWYAIKTCFKRAAKGLNKSRQLAAFFQAVEAEDEPEVMELRAIESLPSARPPADAATDVAEDDPYQDDRDIDDSGELALDDEPRRRNAVREGR